MRVILLRHEKRGTDIGFFSTLTDNGYIDAMVLPNDLKKYNIDEIFSSPFTRTLETSYFTSHVLNKKVNIEYGLYEYLHNIYFSIGEWYYTIDDLKNPDLKKIVNKKYKSIVTKSDFTVLEDEASLERRIIKFFDYLINNYNNKTVLLVTHKGIINKIKNLYFEKTNMDDNFEMGSYQVFELN